MKKTNLVVATIIVLSLLMTACDKNDSEALVQSNSTCTETAFLLPDSLSCSGKNFFLVGNSNIPIAVNTGNAAIDTIVGGASFSISYTSAGGTTACRGAVWQNASLSCFQRR